MGSGPSGDLFADDLSADASGLTVSQILAGKAPASKAHQTFLKLLKKVEARRAEVALWCDFTARFERRLAAELSPLQREIADEQRQLAVFLDEVLRGALPGRALGRVQRDKVIDLLMNLLTALLELGEDAELEAIHDRYAEVSLQQSQQDDLDLTEAFLTDIFGVELDADHGAATPEELLAHGQRKMRERAEAEAQQAQARHAARSGKRSGAAQAKADAAQAAREQAAKELSQSLRDIYRKLASALHPDREPDVQEHQRKTVLMQRVNQAYEANDLLTLLGLQLEIEQIDARHLAEAPAQRVAHYSQILREQLREMDAELAQCQAPLRATLGWDWSPNIKPEKVDQFLSRDLAELRRVLAQLRKDRADWRDPKVLRRFLASYELEPDFDDGFDDPFLMLDELLNGELPQSRRR